MNTLIFFADTLSVNNRTRGYCLINFNRSEVRGLTENNASEDEAINIFLLIMERLLIC